VRSMTFLVLGCAAVALALADPASENFYVLQTGKKCPPEGTGSSLKSKKINREKNRHTHPKLADIDEDISLAAMLAPGDDGNRFSSDKAARITGLVLRVIPGGSGESCNCGAKAHIDMDTHIELALSPGAHAKQRVIVEVSPRFRKMMKEAAPSVDWSSAALKKDIKGKWVTVTGWLLFDYHHADEAENTNPGNKENWRATAWELHPVTSIEVLAKPPAPTPLLAPAAMDAFQSARVRDINRTPGRREEIRKKLASYLEGFTQEELQEAQLERQERRELPDE
jgi:hypothetical protein